MGRTPDFNEIDTLPKLASFLYSHINESNNFANFPIDGLNGKIQTLSDNIDTKFENLDEKISSNNQNIDAIKENISSLQTALNKKLDKLNLDALNSLKDMKVNENMFNSFPSLNGAYGSFKDGLEVKFINSDIKVKILSSFLMFNGDDKFIIVYRVENKDKDTIIIPSVFLTLDIKKSDEKVDDK